MGNIHTIKDILFIIQLLQLYYIISTKASRRDAFDIFTSIFYMLLIIILFYISTGNS